MGILIVYFNIKGYQVIFKDTPIHSFKYLDLTMFGLLLFCAEMAVLLWTSAVVSKWASTSKILKIIIILLIPAFWFLCYTGINGYLSSLATSDIRQVQEVKTRVENNVNLLVSLKKENGSLDKRLSELQEERKSLNTAIATKNERIQSLSVQASERRKTAVNCSIVKDCADSV